MQLPPELKVPAEHEPRQGSPIVLVNPAQVVKPSEHVHVLLPTLALEPAGQAVQAGDVPMKLAGHKQLPLVVSLDPEAVTV